MNIEQTNNIADAFNAGEFVALNEHHRQLKPVLRAIRSGMIERVGFSDGYRHGRSRIAAILDGKDQTEARHD
jgi:hypothetical protein